MKQFLRRVRLTIGVGDQARQIENLRIRFEVVKNQFSNRNPNTASIDVINLAAATRAEIIDHGTQVSLDVGWGDGNVYRNLFTGKLRHAVPVHEGTEWVTTLYCMDAYQQLLESRISLTIKAGTAAFAL